MPNSTRFEYFFCEILVFSEHFFQVCLFRNAIEECYRKNLLGRWLMFREHSDRHKKPTIQLRLVAQKRRICRVHNYNACQASQNPCQTRSKPPRPGIYQRIHRQPKMVQQKKSERRRCIHSLSTNERWKVEST